MILFPAIDLRGGKVVRLLRGAYSRETVYSNDPLSVAKQWHKAGAEYLHIVDLDGAREGGFQNLVEVERIAKALPVKIHFGGGVRSLTDIQQAWNAGAHRVIVGTQFFTGVAFRKEIEALSDEERIRIIISVDCKSPDGSDYFVCHSGWTDRTNITAQQAVLSLSRRGLSVAVVTDISRDGTLAGPNISLLQSILTRTDIKVIASGGISGLEDLIALKNMNQSNLYGVIVGKALYEKKIDLREALTLCR